ncbi:MAG TPA: DnaJ domain-containing protein [Bradyrhizobium sp.]
MKTLYDLLGALPHDDAEDLRTAFRKAVKGAHPDLRPDDPEAALKFRQIIRANDILRDDDQRAAYDHLLGLADQEQESAARHALATKIYKLAVGILALGGVSVTSIASYVLLMQVSTASVTSVPVDQIDALARGSAEIAAITLAGPWELSDRATIPPQQETATVALAAAAPASATFPVTATTVTAPPPADAEGTSTPAVTPRSEAATSEASRARGIAAYRNGDLDGAIAALDQAIQLNPNYAAAYIDRGIVFYRLRKLDRAFADIEKAKRIDRAGHNKSESDTIGKPRSPQAGTDSGLSQVVQRMPGKQASRTEGFTFARMP